MTNGGGRGCRFPIRSRGHSIPLTAHAYMKRCIVSCIAALYGSSVMVGGVLVLLFLGVGAVVAEDLVPILAWSNR